MRRDLGPEGSNSPAKKNSNASNSRPMAPAPPRTVIDDGDVDQSVHSEDEESEGEGISSELS